MLVIFHDMVAGNRRVGLSRTSPAFEEQGRNFRFFLGGFKFTRKLRNSIFADLVSKHFLYFLGVFDDVLDVCCVPAR